MLAGAGLAAVVGLLVDPEDVDGRLAPVDALGAEDLGPAVGCGLELVLLLDPEGGAVAWRFLA
jgi:hypothetical protein